MNNSLQVPLFIQGLPTGTAPTTASIHGNVQFKHHLILDNC